MERTKKRSWFRRFVDCIERNVGPDMTEIISEDNPSHHTARHPKKTSGILKGREDLCCFGILFGICLFVFLSILIISLYASDNSIKKDHLDKIIHREHVEDTGKGREESQPVIREKLTSIPDMISLLHLLEFNTSDSVPQLFGNKCREIEDAELVMGRTNHGTSLPFLLSVLCAIVHRDSGCTGTTNTITPRLVNASLLNDVFRVNYGIEDINPLAIHDIKYVRKKMLEMSDIQFFQVSLSKEEPVFILEDVCVITYKDELGLCYHYLNPEIEHDDETDYTGSIYGDSYILDTVLGFRSDGEQILEGDDMFVHNGVDPRKKSHQFVKVMSDNFKFLGTHSIKLPIPIVVKYQPLFPDDYVIASNIDSLNGIESKKDVLQKYIDSYQESVSETLMEQPTNKHVWMKQVLNRKKVAYPSKERGFHVHTTTKILNGDYLPRSLFDKQETKVK